MLQWTDMNTDLTFLTVLLIFGVFEIDLNNYRKVLSTVQRILLSLIICESVIYLMPEYFYVCFPKNKNIVPLNHKIKTQVQNLTLIHDYHQIIHSTHSSWPIVLITALEQVSTSE